MPDERQLESFAVRSYRYLRLSIVVVVAALLGSVLLERSRVDCWQESISAYHHTPVQAVLVSALLVIGVSLVAIEGSTEWEEVLLDMAGVLAPVVAFVPTSVPERSCASASFEVDDAATAAAFVENNVVSLVIGVAVAAVIAAAVSRRRRRAGGAVTFDPPAVVGMVLTGVVLGGGLLWYLGFRASFLIRAHGAAAIAMFVLLFLVIVINAYSAAPRYRRAYALTATTMALGAVGTVAGQALVGTWRHQILWLEVLQLVPLAVFWAMQTAEHWHGGVPTGDERVARAACIPGLRQRATAPARR